MSICSQHEQLMGDWLKSRLTTYNLVFWDVCRHIHTYMPGHVCTRAGRRKESYPIIYRAGCMALW